MVPIRVDEEFLCPRSAIEFLRHCYRFVDEEWAHAVRDDSPDRGFERTFRSACIVRLTDWEISQEREMGLGRGLSTASGILHEIDIAALHPEVLAIVELKNRAEVPSKNDVINLFAKFLDYLTCNSTLLLKEVCPVFISSSGFDQHGLMSCLGLGIHAVGPHLRPIPILVDNAKRIEVEIRAGTPISENALDEFDELCSGLNNLCFRVKDNSFSNRFGYVSDNTIVVKASSHYDYSENYHSLLHLNRLCDKLIPAVKEAKQ